MTRLVDIKLLPRPEHNLNEERRRPVDMPGDDDGPQNQHGRSTLVHTCPQSGT